MSSLLDSMLDNYAPADTRAVSEQHDPNAINFVAGLSDPGEMIRCGYRPELRRHPGEADAEYAARIHPLVMALPQKERDVIMGAAVKRASLDSTNGKIAVVVAGDPAWHGLGVNVSGLMTWEEACRHSSTNWSVDKVPLHYEHGECFKLATGEFALVRRDTGAFLNRVGSVYQVFQNTEAFQFLDSVVGEHRGRFETAGSLHGGRKLWCQVLLPEQTFEVTPGDAVETRATFFNSHGGEAAWCFLTGTRTVCANTFRTAGTDRKKGISIRHTGDLKAKTAAAQRALGLAVTAAEEFKSAASKMLSTPMQPRPYFEACLDSMLTLTEAEQAVRSGNVLEGMLSISDAERQAAEKSLERKLTARQVNLNDMLDRYEGESNGINGMRGTAWAAFNAVTEHGNHAKRGKQQSDLNERRTRRFESVLDGDRDDLMQVAYQLATGAGAN